VVANVPAPALEVRASARTQEAIRRRCAPLPAGVVPVIDPETPDGSVRCAWGNGRARFDGAAVTEAIAAVLDRCLVSIDQARAASPAPDRTAPQKED
jgi:hypothetical protein